MRWVGSRDRVEWREETGKWQGEGQARSNGAGGGERANQFSAEARQKTHRWPNRWAGVRDGSVRMCMAESHAPSRVTFRTILSDRIAQHKSGPSSNLMCVAVAVARAKVEGAFLHVCSRAPPRSAARSTAQVLRWDWISTGSQLHLHSSARSLTTDCLP